MLTHRLSVLFGEFRIPVLDDLAHAYLGQFLRHELLVEEPALDGSLVLRERSNHLIQVFPADTLGLLALRCCQSLDLDVELAGFFVETDVALLGIVARLAIVGALDGTAVRFLRREVEAGCEHLLHQKARRDGLERVVHRLGHRLFRGVRLGDQVGEACAGLAGSVAGRAADDLHDLGEAGAVADRQRVIAPDPVETLLGHAESDDDVDMVAVVHPVRIPERGRDPLPFAWVVIDQVGDPENPAVVRLDQLEPGSRIGALPIAKLLDDVLHLADLVLGALARVYAGDVDDRLLVRVEHPQDVVGIVPRVEEIADIEPLQILIAVELLVVGVGDGLEPRLVMGHEYRRGVAPEIRSRHGHDVRSVARHELPDMFA